MWISYVLRHNTISKLIRTSQLIKALDSYLKLITSNCPYPSVNVRSVNVQSCNFSQPPSAHARPHALWCALKRDSLIHRNITYLTRDGYRLIWSQVTWLRSRPSDLVLHLWYVHSRLLRKCASTVSSFNRCRDIKKLRNFKVDCCELNMNPIALAVSEFFTTIRKFKM